MEAEIIAGLLVKKLEELEKIIGDEIQDEEYTKKLCDEELGNIIPLEYKTDPEKAKELIEAGFVHTIDFVDDSILTDDLIDFAIKHRYYASVLTRESMRRDPIVMKKLVENGTYNLSYALRPALSKELVELAIAYGYSFYIHDQSALKSDPEIIKIFLEHGKFEAICIANDEALTEENIALAVELYKQDHTLSTYGLDNNPERVITLIKAGCPKIIDRVYYEYVTEEMVIEAIKQRYVLDYTSGQLLKNRKDIVRLFIKNYYFGVFDYVPASSLTSDDLYEAMSLGYEISRYINRDILALALNDERCVKILCEQGKVEYINDLKEESLTDEIIRLALRNGYRIKDSSPKVFKKKEYVLEAVRSGNTYIIQDLDEELLDEEIVMEALERDYPISNTTPFYVRRNINFIRKAIEKGHADAIDYVVGFELAEEDVLFAIEHGYEISSSTDREIKENPLYINRIIANGHPDAIDYADYEALTQENILLAISKGYIPNRSSKTIIKSDPIYIKALLANGKYQIIDLSNREVLKDLEISSEEFEATFNSLIELVPDLNENSMHIYTTMLYLYDKYMKSNAKNPNLDTSAEYIMMVINKALISKYKREEWINAYLDKVRRGDCNPMYLQNINNAKDLGYVINFGDFQTLRAAENNNGMTYKILDRCNKKQYRKIIELLRAIPVTENNIPLLATNIYISIGYVRAVDLLTHRYGKIDEDKLMIIFKNVIPSGVLFESEGKGFKPELNEQLLNLLFGANYKIQNTPIRNYLGNFEERGQELTRLKEKIERDMSISADEKKIRIVKLNEQYEKYVKAVQDFMESFYTVFNSWDIVQEEFIKSTAKSSLKLKMSIEKIVEIAHIVEVTKNTPELEARDEELARSDVFDYAYHDTQFVSDVKEVPGRIITLSRRMDMIETKKFPDLTMSRGKYTMKVYGPHDRRILSAGYRSNCCFRACGNADNSGNDISLLNYCVSTPYGGGVEIRDEQGKTIMFSPILRNGNVVMLHSIETDLRSNLPKECYELIRDFSEEMIKIAEQNGDDISFVTMTDLHYFDNDYAQGSLPTEDKFSVFDPENKFGGMYTNLEHNHMVLASKSGRTFKDIRYGDVEKDYSFDLPVIEYIVQVTEEEEVLINQLQDLKSEYIIMSNARLEALSTGNEQEAYRLLEELKVAKIKYLELYKKVIALKESKDIFADYSKAIGFVRSIDKELGIDRDLRSVHTSDILCGPDWYIIVTRNNTIIANALEKGKVRMLERIKPIIELRNIEHIDSETFEQEYRTNKTI